MYLLKKKKKKNKGFTLVELVVVILVIAILATATFLGGATIIKQSRKSKVQTNLSNYAAYVQDMMYAEPGVANKDAAGAETLLNNKYLTKDFQLGDMKDSWGNNYNFKFATGTVDDADSKTHKYTYTIINSNGANGIDNSINVATTLSSTDYASAQKAVDTATLTTGDDLGIVVLLRDGAVSTAYYGFNGNSGGNGEEVPVVLTAGLYETGTTTLAKITVGENEVDATWENIKAAYPDAFTIENTIKGSGGTSYLTSLSGDLVISNDITSIYESAFYNCTSLTSIIISNKVISIELFTFSGCSGLTSITIPNGVKTINPHAFSSCTSLTSVTIPDSVTSISDSAFINCAGLKSITIPNSVTSIGECAFQNCSKLTSITIPNSITSISDSMLRNCTELTSVIIPYNITSIENNAFSGCTKFESITFDGTIAQWNGIAKGDDWKYNVPTNCVVHCKDGNTTI